MLELLQFIFSIFWIWLGTAILLGAVANVFYGGVASIIALLRR